MRKMYTNYELTIITSKRVDYQPLLRDLDTFFFEFKELSDIEYLLRWNEERGKSEDLMHVCDQIIDYSSEKLLEVFGMAIQGDLQSSISWKKDKGYLDVFTNILSSLIGRDDMEDVVKKLRKQFLIVPIGF